MKKISNDNNNLSDKNRIILISNFKRIMKICDMVQEESLFIGLIGESSYGKTFTFNEYAKKHDNVYKVEVTPSMTPKRFYLELLKQLSKNTYSSNMPLWYLIEKNAQSLWSLKRKSLVIIDEAGNFKKGMHKFIRELRDKTKGHCGIIMAGPKYFKQNMVKWEYEEHPGIAEIMSRVNQWLTLPKHTIEDARKICSLYNITDKAFIAKCHSKKYLSKIFDAIWEYLKTGK